MCPITHRFLRKQTKLNRAMILSTTDIIVLVLLLLSTVLIGLYFGRSKKKTLSEYFLGGRSLPWYIAGISMVATTFAADTPLAVTELVGQYGISGNWLWWNLLAGGMLTTVFFARLWRRSGLTTEVEFIEFRYSGRPAALLRGFKAIYLGGIMNVLIMGWVNVAMITLLEGFFGMTHESAFVWTGVALLIVVFYVSFSGLKGVVYTDVFQFVLAMSGSIALAYYVLKAPEIGGLAGLRAALPEETFSFLPSVGEGGAGGRYQISLASFLAFFGMVWWTSWYPGAEPGGGGYSAQRMLSTKDERSSFLASALFQIGHYAVRPWPWIIVALSAIALYGGQNNLAEQTPDFINYECLTGVYECEPLTSQQQTEYAQWLETWQPVYGDRLPEALKYQQDYRFGYIFIMRDYLPKGILGMLLASFFAAYMSTMSTQLNWGSSYVVNDLYARFINKEASEKQKVIVGKLTTVLLMICAATFSFYLQSAKDVFDLLLQIGAGTGLLFILRWFWNRINPFSEIAAMAISFMVALFFFINGKQEVPWIEIAGYWQLIIGVIITTIGWVSVTLLTKPSTKETLDSFEKLIFDGEDKCKNIGFKIYHIFIIK